MRLIRGWVYAADRATAMLDTDAAEYSMSVYKMQCKYI